MRYLSSGEKQKLAKQIEEYTAELKSNIQSHNESQAREEKSRYRRLRWVGWMFQTPRILVKDPVYISDLPDLEKDLAYSSIEAKIKDTIKDIMTSKSKYMKKFIGMSHVYGLYDHIIKKIVRKDIILLRLLGISQSLSISFNFYLIMKAFETQISNCETSLSINLIHIILISILTVGSFILKLKIQAREERIKNQSSQALRYMIYEKLNDGDSYFLENSDNNMIYKLLYLEFEDYIKYVHSNVILWRTAPFIGLAILTIYQYFSRVIVIFNICMFLIIGIRYSLKYIRIKNHQKYKYMNFEMRKTMYELLKNFQFLIMKGLKKRYSLMFSSYLLLKKAPLKVIHRIEWFENSAYHFCIAFIFLTELSFLITEEKLEPLSDSKKCHLNHSIVYSKPDWNEINRLRFLIPLLCILAFLDSYIMESIRYLSIYFNYKSSRELYDKFFDNDFVIGGENCIDESLEKGEIRIRNCQVLERDSKNMNEILDFIMDKSDYKIQDVQKVKSLKSSSTLNKLRRPSIDIFSSWSKIQSKTNPSPNSIPESLNHLNVNQNIKSIKIPSDQLQKIAGTPNSMRSRLKRVFSSLNFNIFPSSRICIYENKNKSCVRGFIKMILGENFVNEGSISHNSTISYLNPNRMHFLVGMTIRDNILFGQEYNYERYQDLLKLLNLQFGNYFGYDFYQISEQGKNLKTEDQRLVMMARFLYKESDVYIIEEYFNSINMSLTFNKLRSIFQNRLKRKTLIYVTNKEEMISMSDYVISFNHQNDVEISSGLEFLDILQREKVPPPSPLKRNDSRGQVLLSKLKNTVFIANISYEEELNIHRKLEQRKREIEDMKKKKTNIFEILSYGIYLTNKRRQEGINLEEQNPIDFRTFWCFLSNELKSTKKKQMLLSIFMMYFLCLISQTTAEIYLYIQIPNSLTQDAFTKNISFCLFFICSSILLRIARGVIKEKLLSSSLLRLNSQLIDSILNAEIRTILKSSSHTVLDKVTGDTMRFEYKMLDIIHLVFNTSTHIIILTAVLCYIYSVYTPILIIPFILYLFYYSLKILVKSYMRLHSLKAAVEARFDTMNYQILKLIEGYRISNIMNKVRTKQKILSDNKIKISIVFAEFKELVQKIKFGLLVFTGIVFFGVAVLYRSYSALNLFNVRKEYFLWSLLLCVQFCLKIGSLTMNSIEIFDILISYLSIDRFKRSLEKKKKAALPYEIRSLSMRERNPSLKSLVNFQNVSLTLGYQPILKKISFKVRKGEMIALFGIEGSGRSTIFELLSRILKMDESKSSKISVFGKPIEDIDEEEIKTSIFLVERNPILFEGIVKDNIDPYSTQKIEQLHMLLTDLGFKETRVNSNYDNSDKMMKKPNQYYIGKRISIFDVKKVQNDKLNSVHSFVPESEFSSNLLFNPRTRFRPRE